jgi:Tfp pilus assembly protein PilN
MNFFRINLNKLEDREAALRRQRHEVLLYMGLTLAVFALLLVCLTLNARLSAKASGFRRTIDDLNGQIQALRQSEHFVSEREVYDLDRLNSTRIFWTRKLESLADLTGDRIALTEIRYERDALTLRGVAKVRGDLNNFDLVSDFIERIKAEPAFTRDFQRIDFRSSNRADFMEQDLLNFDIVMQ